MDITLYHHSIPLRQGGGQPLPMRHVNTEITFCATRADENLNATTNPNQWYPRQAWEVTEISLYSDECPTCSRVNMSSSCVIGPIYLVCLLKKEKKKKKQATQTLRRKNNHPIQLHNHRPHVHKVGVTLHSIIPHIQVLRSKPQNP